jgi:hypothetical protein
MKVPPQKTTLWVGTAVTAAAALFFPKIEAIKNNDEPLWRLAVFVVPGDRERATQALAAISVGSIAFAMGAAIWVLA